MSKNTDHLGELIRRFRKKRKLTQHNLAEKCDLQQSDIAELENGKIEHPSKSRLLRLASGLELDSTETDDLLLHAGLAPVSKSHIKHPALQKLLMILNSEPSSSVLLPLDSELIVNFAEAFLRYSEAKQSQYKRDWPQTIQLCDEGERKIADSTTRLIAYMLDAKGTAHIHLGEFQAAEDAYAHASDLTAKVDDSNIGGLVHAHKGDLHRHQSRWEAALNEYEEARRQFADLKDAVKGAWVRRKIGVVYLIMGDWPTARNHLEYSLGIFEETQDQYELAKIYIALGWVHSLRGDWERALSFRKAALSLAPKVKILDEYTDRYLLMQAHLYFGYDCIQIQEYEVAEEHLKEALNISKELQEKQERGLIHLGLARLYQAKGKNYWQNAELEFEESLRLHEEIGDKQRMAVTLNHSAKLFLKQRNYDKAIKLLQSARESFSTLGSLHYVADATVYLCDAYRCKGNLEAVDVWAEPLIRVLEKEDNPYFQHLARLKSIRAIALNENGLFDKGFALFADSFLDAVQFNRYLCREIAQDFLESLKKALAKNLSQNKGAFYCGQLSTDLKEQLGKVELKKKLRIDADHLLAWLSELPNQILSHRNLQPLHIIPIDLSDLNQP